MRPSQPPRLGLAFASLFVIAMLAAGNPFLPEAAAGTTDEQTGAGPGPTAVAPPADEPTMAVLAGGTALPCPAAEYQDDVVEQGVDAHGEPYWVLGDGRVVRRKAQPHAGGATFVLFAPGEFDVDPAAATHR